MNRNYEQYVSEIYLGQVKHLEQFIHLSYLVNKLFAFTSAYWRYIKSHHISNSSNPYTDHSISSCYTIVESYTNIVGDGLILAGAATTSSFFIALSRTETKKALQMSRLDFF